MRTREYLERGEGEGRTLLDAMRDGELDGMQHFDGELEKLLRADVITRATALLFATNAGNLQLQIADIPPDTGDSPESTIAISVSSPGEASCATPMRLGERGAAALPRRDPQESEQGLTPGVGAGSDPQGSERGLTPHP